MNSRFCGAFLILTLSALGQTSTYRGGLVTPPLTKPAFTLNDTSGVAFDFRDRTEGRVTLLFFGYTNCPDQCPMHMANIGAALKNLPADIADQVKLVFVTTDPARDTPAKLRRWLDMFESVSLASAAPKPLSRQSKGLREFPWPKKRSRAVETILLRMQILSLRTPGIIWPM